MRAAHENVLRIAVDGSTAAEGGGVSYLAEQVPRLAELGVHLTVFATDALRAALADDVEADVILVAGRSSVGRLLRLNWSIARASRHRKWDAIYCPGSTAPLTGRLPKVVCIQNPHLFGKDAPRDPRLTVLRIASWLSALRAADVILISHATAIEWSRTSALGIDPKVIYSGPGALRVRRHRDARRRARPYILAVSNLHWYKRMDLVIDAYASDQELRSGFDLVIAGAEGEPGVTDALRRRARQHGCEHVHIVGFVSGTALSDLYSGASAYVSASEREAFPLTPAEAMLAGTPAALTPLAVFRELYGQWAAIANDWTPTAVAAAIRATLNRPPPSPDAISQQFSWERNALAVHNVLSNAVATGRPSWRVSLARVRFRRLPVLWRTVLGREPLSRSDAQGSEQRTR